MAPPLYEALLPVNFEFEIVVFAPKSQIAPPN